VDGRVAGGDDARMDVGFFVTCLTDTFFPRVGEAAVRVLRHFGCRVHFPPQQTCCGQPAYNSGFHDHAAALLRRMPKAFASCEFVVTPSASCATMVKEHGPRLAGVNADEVRLLAAKTWEFCTFLRDRLHVDIAACLKPREPVTFHYPCHARGIYEVADLLDWLGRLDVRPPPRTDLCCGFGGLFAVDFPELSGRMLDDKLEMLAASGARLVICNEAACTLQMAGGAHRRGLPLRFRHLAELLAESLGLMEGEA